MLGFSQSDERPESGAYALGICLRLSPPVGGSTGRIEPHRIVACDLPAGTVNARIQFGGGARHDAPDHIYTTLDDVDRLWAFVGDDEPVGFVWRDPLRLSGSDAGVAFESVRGSYTVISNCSIGANEVAAALDAYVGRGHAAHATDPDPPGAPC